MWDGTRCQHPLLKALVEPSVIEGPLSFGAKIEELVANIFVYDNHVEFARQLKVSPVPLCPHRSALKKKSLKP